jgi:hypothetical protein
MIRIPGWEGQELPPASFAVPFFAVPFHDASSKIEVAKPWKGRQP